MSEPRRLSHPPITEAVIDFRADLGVGFDAVRLRKAEDLLSGRYVLENEQHLFVRTVMLMGEAPAGVDDTDPVLAGYTFRSPDGRFVTQLTVEGLAVSQLHGYTQWEELADEAATLWDVYSRVATPKTVLRVGTRFLNSIQVPRKAVSLDEYFTTLPRVPTGVPRDAASFLVRMLLHTEGSPHSVSFTQYIESPDDDASRMILDIDAFSRETYEPDGRMMWEALGGLRELKNRVFFGSLTEKALELFE